MAWIGAQVEDFFTHLLQRVVPKHDVQARAEVTVTRRFLENFSGDQVRSWSGHPRRPRDLPAALTMAHMPLMRL